MDNGGEPKVGTIGWVDLTVADAEGVRDFYQEVVGWRAFPQSMGEYEDYEMALPNSEERVTGVCHARGENTNVPPQWLIYVLVADVEASARRAVELGGRVLDGPRMMGPRQFAVIQDPAGAVLALMDS